MAPPMGRDVQSKAIQTKRQEGEAGGVSVLLLWPPLLPQVCWEQIAIGTQYREEMHTSK